MPINKLFASCAEAVADIPDGATIMVAGFGAGHPKNLVEALKATLAQEQPALQEAANAPTPSPEPVPTTPSPPDPNITSDARTVTTVPLQQLFVLNSEFMVRNAKALTGRLGALGEAEALMLLREWNRNCVPPWSETELAHKVRSAAAAPHSDARGHLLGGGLRHCRGGNAKAQRNRPHQTLPSH